MKLNDRSFAKRGENNPSWKGDAVGYQAVHGFVRRRKIKPLLCERCKKRKAWDLANISQQYKRDLKDWEYLCRKCHMAEDGRSESLRLSGKSRRAPDKKCLVCKKVFHYTSRMGLAKYCSQKCFHFTQKGVSRPFYNNQYTIKNGK